MNATWEGTRRVVYGEGATFVPVCPKCGRFMTSDAKIVTRGERVTDEPNATCRKCGRVAMPFEGWV